MTTPGEAPPHLITDQLSVRHLREPVEQPSSGSNEGLSLNCRCTIKADATRPGNYVVARWTVSLFSGFTPALGHNGATSR